MRLIAAALSMLLAINTASTKEINNPDQSIKCDSCERWNTPQKPFKIFGNTYYVGVKGLAAILIATPRGLVLLDGGLPQSAPLIEQNIRSLGFAIKDIKWILNSHAHYDHAGGIAALQRDSEARIAASISGAQALQAGRAPEDDPQFAFGESMNFPSVKKVKKMKDGEKLRIGKAEITAHSTPGHTPGGTTWTWNSCEGNRCLTIVYADSLNAISAPGFRFSGGKNQPDITKTFKASIEKVANLPCDILLTVHPELSSILDKAEDFQSNLSENPFIDPQACRKYAENATQRLEQRLAEERATSPE